MSSRKYALQALIDVTLHGHSWEKIQFEDPETKAFCSALALGVIRHIEALHWLLGKILKKPLKNKDQDIELILIMGLFELWQMNTPTHAAINETVKLVPGKKPWAKGLVNGALRSFLDLDSRLRRNDKIDMGTQKQKPKIIETLSNIPCLPEWLILQLKQDHGPALKTIIAETTKHPPQHCRVNRSKIAVDDYIAKYCQDIDVIRHCEFPDALTFITPKKVEAIPGFADGLISIQDLAPQKTPYLLDLKPGDRVLDACAAPGGKTCHMLEYCSDIELTAWDIDAIRLERVCENLERLGLEGQNLRLLATDASQSGSRDDTKCYNKILIDAPCSATGIIRRHPDIKLHRRPDDIPKLAATQLSILKNLWPSLETGGTLLYATCSILRAENQAVIEAFVAQTPDASLDYEKQFLPGEMQADGFFYAKLVKRSH